MKIIDAHCHIGFGRYKKLSPETLLEQMNSCGVDKAIVVPVEDFMAVYNEEGNDFVLDAVNKSDGRFIGFATVNPWLGEKAVEILKYYMDRGLKGIKLHPSIQGFLLNDALVDPVIQVAQDYRVPVYFHTGTPFNALPFQLGDLASRFPKVNFIMGHMASFDFGYDIVLAGQGLDNLFYETSHSVSLGVSNAIRNIGEDRIIFGSNAPRSDIQYEIEKIKLICQEERILNKVFSKNILSLIG